MFTYVVIYLCILYILILSIYLFEIFTSLVNNTGHVDTGEVHNFVNSLSALHIFTTKSLNPFVNF